VFANQLSQRCEVTSLVRPYEVRQPLRRDAEGITDGEADALLAEVKGQNAGMRAGQSISL